MGQVGRKHFTKAKARTRTSAQEAKQVFDIEKSVEKKAGKGKKPVGRKGKKPL
ncbi:MAG: hypothetical protein H6839_15650 [Planctomycetes bacterium]|nr:hypothetical protein [Planctomycetota bacterium]